MECHAGAEPKCTESEQKAARREKILSARVKKGAAQGSKIWPGNGRAAHDNIYERALTRADITVWVASKIKKSYPASRHGRQSIERLADAPAHTHSSLFLQT